ncbi:MAG TPA: hypothetical protein VFV00_05045 [Acidimicrobiales bacterium]|nr:hypothetical protein [Acidimicrobiales bacterium]
MVVLVTLLGVAVGLLALLVAGLLRSHAEILRALNELGVDLDPNRGARANTTLPPRAAADSVADVTGTDADGAAQHIAVAGVEHNTLLAFLSTTCLTCRDFWSAFADPSLDVPGRARVVIVTRSEEAESPSSVRRLAPRTVHTVMSTETWHAYNVPGAPYFILVDGARSQVIGEGTATAWERVQELMRQAMADANEAGRGGRTVDDELRAAGIEPGDPSLYPETGT